MFTILSRREAGSEKCPRCSRVNVDFMDLGLGMLGCFDCGSVFIRRSERIRSKFSEKKVEIEIPVITSADNIMEVPLETAVPPVGYTCGTCGKGLKTKLALAGHMRSHR